MHSVDLTKDLPFGACIHARTRARAIGGRTGLQSYEAARAALLSQDYILLQRVEERVALQQHRNYDALAVVSTSLAFVRNHMIIMIHCLAYSGLA